MNVSLATIFNSADSMYIQLTRGCSTVVPVIVTCLEGSPTWLGGSRRAPRRFLCTGLLLVMEGPLQCSILAWFDLPFAHEIVDHSPVSTHDALTHHCK